MGFLIGKVLVLVPGSNAHSLNLDVGGASEVDETEHSEVQLALLLHVHEDRQLQSEEEVSRSPGIFFPPANKAPITIYFILICSTSSMLV